VTNRLHEVDMLLEMVVLMLGLPYHQMVIVSYAALDANTVFFLSMNIERAAGPIVPFSAKVIAFEFHVVLGHSFGRLEKKPE
jgi:uncharacterized membrane protein